MAGLTADARAAFDDHIAAADAARAATARFYDAVAAMHGSPGAGSDMIRTIRTFALTSDDPTVYSLAQIPPPATPARPGETPPPALPTDIRTDLLQTGAVGLSWACANPPGTSGTIYEILRSVDGGPMGFVASVGAKRFIDDTVPAGAAAVTYQITATRSTARGRPARFTVRFGAANPTAAATQRGAAVQMVA